MKKLYAYLLAVAVLLGAGGGRTAYALNPPVPVPREILEMKLREFVRLSARDFSRITETKLNLRSKLSFSLLKMDMKKSLKKHPDLTVGQYLAKPTRQEINWLIVLGIVLAVILALIMIKYMKDFEDGLGL